MMRMMKGLSENINGLVSRGNITNVRPTNSNLFMNKVIIKFDAKYASIMDRITSKIGDTQTITICNKIGEGNRSPSSPRRKQT